MYIGKTKYCLRISMCARVGDDESSPRRKVHSLPSLERASFSKDLFQIILYTFLRSPTPINSPFAIMGRIIYFYILINHTVRNTHQIIVNIHLRLNIQSSKIRKKKMKYILKYSIFLYYSLFSERFSRKKEKKNG